MVEAMCWDLADNVTADYAYANRECFSFFCPHSCCLQEVRSEHRVNTYFFALGSHIAGCPNESRKPENKDTTSRPAKKLSIVPPPATPTELGPARNRGSKKRAKPTRDDLLALSAMLTGQPPRCAGTLLEVVRAWHRMSKHQRLNAPLSINNEPLTYESAFYCVSKLGDNSIDQLPGTTRVIYGTVLIAEDKDKDGYWLKSVKTYKVSNTDRIHLRIRVPKDGSPTAQYLAELLATSKNAKSFALFYFGLVPKLSGSGKSYGISSDIADDYKRFVILPDC